MDIFERCQKLFSIALKSLKTIYWKLGLIAIFNRWLGFFGSLLLHLTIQYRFLTLFVHIAFYDPENFGGRVSAYLKLKLFQNKFYVIAFLSDLKSFYFSKGYKSRICQPSSITICQVLPGLRIVSAAKQENFNRVLVFQSQIFYFFKDCVLVCIKVKLEVYFAHSYCKN